jgi:transcriptional regulator with XRE-family HTH domain
MLSKERLGERIRGLRLARGLTLKEFGLAAGLSAPHLCEIEQGKTSPTFGALAKIAAALERPVAYLLEEETRPDVSVVRRGERVPQDAATDGPASGACMAHGTPLTHGIPSGRLVAYRLVLAAEERAGSSSVDAESATVAPALSTADSDAPPGRVPAAAARTAGDGRGAASPAATMPSRMSRQSARFLTEAAGSVVVDDAGTASPPAPPRAAARGRASGQEGGVLLAGRVEARVDGVVRVLERGDVAFFDAARPHELFNPGPGPAELLWFRLDGTDD